jgi:hypothetical protein
MKDTLSVMRDAFSKVRDTSSIMGETISRMRKTPRGTPSTTRVSLGLTRGPDQEPPSHSGHANGDPHRARHQALLPQAVPHRAPLLQRAGRDGLGSGSDDGGAGETPGQCINRVVLEDGGDLPQQRLHQGGGNGHHDTKYHTWDCRDLVVATVHQPLTMVLDGTLLTWKMRGWIVGSQPSSSLR